MKEDKEFLMSLLAAMDVSAEDYANFLRSNKRIDFLQSLKEGTEEDTEFDYVPMTDADNKTLRLKIQLRGVTKPPMWRELLVPADFNFTQLHYAIQAVMGLDNWHLWLFQRSPYDHRYPSIGIPIEDSSSFGIEDCSSHADQTPLTAYLAQKGDKLVYVYDFRMDWIFDVTVAEVLDRRGEVAECIKYKSELQAMDGVPSFLYPMIRSYHENPGNLNKKDVKELMSHLQYTDRDMLDAYIDDLIIDLEFVNEELADIPDNWEPID